MSIRKKLFSNIFIRNALTDFGARSNLALKTYDFTPYFKYTIGSYDNGYVLTFLKPPRADRYYNEIFNKIAEYSGFEIAKYLNFHFQEFAIKEEFLDFLIIEVDYRLNYCSKSVTTKLQLVKQWSIIEREKLQSNQSRNNLNVSETSIKELLSNNKLLFGTPDIEKRFNDIQETLEKYLEYGSIVMNSKISDSKLIQLFIILQHLHILKLNEPLFNRFSSFDLALLLKRNFHSFKDFKVSTLQKRITSESATLFSNNNTVNRLLEAMELHFEI